LNREALRGLKEGEVDAALLVGPAQAPAIREALRDPDVKLMSFTRADTYPRRFPYIKTLTLTPGAIDLALRIPEREREREREVRLIGTKAMLVARDDLRPALIELLLNAARELHSQQGLFEADDEFPNTARVDLPVSTEAIRHFRFGPRLPHRYMPFRWRRPRVTSVC
jgi:TRAP-type uncharacterized transport system substrate-binding protein